MSSAAKIGLFMLTVIAVAAFFILRIEDIRIDRGTTTKKIDVIFDSVAGLQKKSTVRVAGVPVGKVTDINLTPDGRARVTLEVDSAVQLRQGAHARVANLGLLGEQYVELEPGPAGAPVISSENLVLGGSQPATIDDVTSQVSDIAKDVKAITASLRGAIGGEEGQQRIEEIFENVHQITERVRLIIEVNQGNINATAENFRRISDDLRVEIPRIANSIDRFANSISGTVTENRSDVRAVVENLRALSSDLRVTADNLNDITGRVRSGEGTVGKLLYSDEAHEKLTSALGSVESGVTELKNVLGRVGRIQMDLGVRADYYAGLEPAGERAFEGNSRSALSMNLIPNPDRNRFYFVELSDDPRGQKKEKIVTTTTIDEEGNESTVTTRQTKFERDFLVSAQAGWQFDNLGLRIGLFDNAGGVGADYAMNDRIVLTGEAFDFGGRRDDNPHLRLFGRYVIRKEKEHSPAIFVSTGVDNPLNDTAFTIGGGIRWRDEDLKYLLGSIPSIK